MLSDPSEIPGPARESAQGFLNFVNDSPTPYHAIDTLKKMLLDAGFVELRIEDSWNLQKQGGYFVIKNSTTIAAFLVGGQTTNGNPIDLIATHTDSPCLKVKRGSNRGYGSYSQVGVMLYGGGMWYSWFDRELKLAGKVWIQRPNGKVENALIHVNKPILYIPHLAIHFKRSDTFTPDLELHTLPIIGLKEEPNPDPSDDPHNPFILKLVCDETNAKPDEIVEMDLSVVEYAPARFVGINEEFMAGARFDNLVSTYTAIKALIDTKSSSQLGSSKLFHMVVCFNNEEVGNNTTEGARTDFLTQVVTKVVGGPQFLAQSIDQSFAISADVVHGIHPNYWSYYEKNHSPELYGGPVIKYNAAMKYATNGYTAMIAKEVGRLAGVETQSFIVKNDSLSGSTLGPDLAACLGINTVDIGTSMLAMHSVREFAGTVSISQAIDYFAAFFKYYEQIKDMIE